MTCRGFGKRLRRFPFSWQRNNAVNPNVCQTEMWAIPRIYSDSLSAKAAIGFDLAAWKPKEGTRARISRPLP
ncbi:hypothetical protein TcasGA2_TC016392 [Tribolium castaneum]|uniref:Uncharacterized protein n=1 Tax=Tribolium castaneum TaxID=7070 RepID=D2CFX4_TRICA|nr:hypothetical protein TcasGA2_TC016392 [Tribolium castaneum]